jgi:hypothetical protein
MKLDFICESWNQVAVEAMDAHTFTKQAEKLKPLPARKVMDGWMVAVI